MLPCEFSESFLVVNFVFILSVPYRCKHEDKSSTSWNIHFSMIVRVCVSTCMCMHVYVYACRVCRFVHGQDFVVVLFLHRVRDAPFRVS